MMGERHCRVYSGLRNVELVGVADLDAERGKLIASRYDTRCFEDYRDLLSRVDAVSIATATPAHFPLALESLENDVHVLVEKPITETIDQARALIETAKKRNLVLQVGHIERFNPAFIELERVIKGMSIFAINIRRLSPFDTSNTDVDVIRDLMIHDLDLAVALAGDKLEGISAWGRSITTEAIDHAVANLSFRHGPIATLMASRVTEQKIRQIEIIAHGAYIEADLLSKSLMIHRRTLPQYFDADKYRQESIIERIHVPMAEPLVLELQHFVSAVRDGTPVRVPGEAGLKALQLAQAISDQIVGLTILSDYEAGA
ncbi:MAG: gfo/Idh/MocA family oxidoreductase [Chloroflexi bacterium]|nr:MAG: gfo/Idh/MocA family oxidoreductase [Chloroflexota bacterium]